MNPSYSVRLAILLLSPAELLWRLETYRTGWLFASLSKPAKQWSLLGLHCLAINIGDLNPIGMLTQAWRKSYLSLLLSFLKAHMHKVAPVFMALCHRQCTFIPSNDFIRFIQAL